jgi:uncharacterized protein (TIGR04255 family)
MIAEQLATPPIVEALVEVRWAMDKTSGPIPIDPHYQLLLGSFYQKVKNEYPFHEALPAASIPDEVTGSVVKHRFRVAKDSWPLIQIGPGVMSVNETNKYTTFEKFKPHAIQALTSLFDAHPKKSELEIKRLILRYIDAKELNYSQENIHNFISNKMHIPMELPDFIFQNGRLETIPTSFRWQTSLRCNDPAGMAILTFSTGIRSGKPALIWEQILQSEDDDIDDMPSKFEEWIDSAHEVIYAWFEKLIEGDLKTEFSKNE